MNRLSVSGLGSSIILGSTESFWTPSVSLGCVTLFFLGIRAKSRILRFRGGDPPDLSFVWVFCFFSSVFLTVLFPISLFVCSD